MSIFFTLLLLFGMSLHESALAASSVMGRDSKMQFNLPVDARCNLSLASNVVDYGTLSRWQLRDSATSSNMVTPGKRTLTLSVVCPYSQRMIFTLRGERAVNGDLRYGENGSMILRLLDAQLDGQNVLWVGTTLDGLINRSANESRLLQPGQSFAPSANGRLAKGKILTMRFEIEPKLPEADARVSSSQSSEARLKVELMD